MREPTTSEIESITALYEDYTPSYIAVWDNYISDCPGYRGWIAVTIGGSPEYCGTLTKDHEGKIELCREVTEPEISHV